MTSLEEEYEKQREAFVDLLIKDMRQIVMNSFRELDESPTISEIIVEAFTSIAAFVLCQEYRKIIRSEFPDKYKNDFIE